MEKDPNLMENDPNLEQNEPTVDDLIDKKSLRAAKVQDIYYKASIGLIIFSVVLFILSAFVASLDIQTFPAREAAELSRALMYISLFMFFFGIILLVYLLLLKRKRKVQMQIYKTIIGIFTNPFSTVIYLTATVLFALSRCSS